MKDKQSSLTDFGFPEVKTIMRFSWDRANEPSISNPV